MYHSSVPSTSNAAILRRGAEAFLIAGLFLAPALYNGFPLLFSDSGEYFARSVVLQVPEYRTFGYSVWLAIAWPGASLWAGVVAQSFLLGALVWQLARVVVPGFGTSARLIALAAVAALTAGPWVASQMMPDVFAPVTVIAVYLMVLHWQALSVAARTLCVVGLAIGVTTHATHLWIAVGLLGAFAALAWARKRWLWRGIARALGTVATGAACLVAVNYAQTGSVFFSRGGHVYLMAHLIDTGLAQRLLRERCPDAGYALCPYQAQISASAADFIWKVEVNVAVLGGWSRSNGEAERVLRDVIRRYPLEYGASLVAYTARQFAALNTFDGLSSYADTWYVANFISHFLPNQEHDFRSAAQQHGAFTGTRTIPSLHAGVFWLAVAASLWLLVSWTRRRSPGDDPAGMLLLTVWLVLLGNAAMCANVSGVFDRYQTRVAWLLPLAVALAVAARRPSATVERGAPVQP